MTNEYLIQIVAEKYDYCFRMWNKDRAIPEDRKTEWDREFEKKWKEDSAFWLKMLCECRKLGCVGYHFREYTWTISAEKEKLFFSVNGKKLPMKKVSGGWLYQIRKTRVNFSDLENIVAHFLETMREKSAFQCATWRVFEHIEKFGKAC